MERTIKAVIEICLKSRIPINSSWLRSNQLLKVFKSRKKFKKSNDRDYNTETNNTKKFCESLETLFNRAAKNAEQQLSGDRLRIEKSKKKDVAFFIDQRNNRETQMSILDNELREKW